MDIDRYVGDLRSQLSAAAGAGGDDARALAERLSTALEPALRLVLLEALSDAASEITREIAPGSVDVRLRGREPELVVTRPLSMQGAEVPATQEQPTAEPVADPAEAVDDGNTTRTTLRLPEHLKVRVERAASEDGLSVNAWLVRAVVAALEPRTRRTAQREARGGDRFTGWVR